MTMDRTDRRARRRAGRIILAAGVVLAVAGIVLPFILGAAFVSYPGGPVDQTTLAVGRYTQLVNPATLAPQSPRSRVLCLVSRLRTVETTGGTVILQQDGSESLGPSSPAPPAPPPPTTTPCPLPSPLAQFSQRYAIDQDSVRNVASPQAYAYTPGNTVDRSPAYSVNLPLGTGHGPYLMWDDATGQTYRISAEGSTTRDGLGLERFGGTAPPAPVSAAFLATLSPLGLPSTMTLDQLEPQLAPQLPVNPAANWVDVIKSALKGLSGNDLNTTSDRAVVDGILLKPMPVSYLLSTQVQLQVYPKTGTIVSADVMQTLQMRSEIAGLQRVLAILSTYTGNATINGPGGAISLLTKLATAKPTPLFTAIYSPKPQSVASAAALAKSRGDDIDTLTVTIPLIIGLVGLVLILAGAALLVFSRRRAGLQDGRA